MKPQESYTLYTTIKVDLSLRQHQNRENALPGEEMDTDDRFGMVDPRSEVEAGLFKSETSQTGQFGISMFRANISHWVHSVKSDFFFW